MFGWISKVKSGINIVNKIRTIVDEGRDIPLAIDNLKDAVEELYEEYDDVSDKVKKSITKGKDAYEEIKDVAEAIKDAF